MRLITKSGSARDADSQKPLQRLALAPLEPRLYRDPAITELEEERIFNRSWQLVTHVTRIPKPGDYITGRAGSQPVLVLRDEDGDAARLPQRLPPPRLAPPERIRPVRQGDPLPVPRLDLPDGRRADRRPRGPLHRRPRQGEARAVPRARRDALRPRLREPRHPRGAAGGSGGGAAGAARALRDRPARALRRVAQHAAGQLEDRHRQLQRGLPRPDRPPGADAPPRLQALRRRGRTTAGSGSRRRSGTSRPATRWSARTSGSCRRCRGSARRTGACGAT